MTRLADLLLATAGIRLLPTKGAMVERRLGGRLEELGVDFDSYLDRLQDDSEELESCINWLTTNVTGFFRERHHFEALGAALEGWRGPVRVLSAGCSTGEEAYSVAMTLLAAGRLDAEVVACDLNSKVLERARRGLFLAEQVSELGPSFQRLFQRGTGPNSGWARVKPKLRKMVTFRPVNLRERLPFAQSFHAIFCRNVMIYLDSQVCQRLLTEFHRFLFKDGLLFLGHSESCRETERFRMVGRTTFLKVGPA